jgi:hypothetical protein
MRIRNLTLLGVIAATSAVGAQGRQGPGVSQSVTVRPPRDLMLFDECDQARIRQDGSTRAIQICQDAVAAADAAGAAAFAPRDVRSFLGDVYMFATRWSDAIDAYRSALGIVKLAEESDLYTGEMLTKIAVAEANLGDLAAADRNAESAAATLRTSLMVHPEQRREHVASLRSTLLFQARVRRLRGDEATAQELEHIASALDDSR